MFAPQGFAATVNGKRAAITSVKAPPPAPVSARKAPNSGIHTSTATPPKATARKARATDSISAHPTPALKGTCERADRNHRYYRAAGGVVCWDGQIYSTADSGIPQYMVDYFQQDQRSVQPAEWEAPLPGRPAVYARASVARSEAVPTVPISPEVFSSIGVGMARSAVLDKLGKPAGSITIPGDDGFVEIWTYQLTNGGTAKLNMEKGIVSKLDPKKDGT